jgi:hypothetical protein
VHVYYYDYLGAMWITNGWTSTIHCIFQWFHKCP